MRGADSITSTLRDFATLSRLTILFFIFFSSISAGDDKDTGGGSAEAPQKSSETQVIQAFTSRDVIDSEIIKIDDQRKRQIMFAMGVPLLLFISITVGLGIAMGVFGKDVYIAHMVFAGLSLTLALGHAIVGMVWFWPF
ncbi:MAG TPA: hypothetical protein VIM41_02120 [Gammaproteobacteria bacterium]